MYLEKNMALLKTKHPELTQKLQSLNIENNKLIDIYNLPEKALYTCRVRLQENCPALLLHSYVDPINEARERVNLINLDNKYFIAVIGFGFGYYVREILKKRSSTLSTILVIEPRLDILKTALSLMDFTDVLANPEVEIIDGNDNTTLFNLLMTRLHTLKSIEIFQSPTYNFIVEGGTKQYRDFLYDNVNLAFNGLGNDAADTLIGIQNIFGNIKYLLDSPKLDKAKTAYKKMPAIIVSAGPSLDKNYHLLKEAKGKALILTADTSLKKLLNAQIVPDIVLTLERLIESYDYFYKDVNIPESIVFFGSGVVPKVIFDNFPGKKVVLLRDSIPSEAMFSEVLKHVETFEYANSVAHMAYSIASILGCNPIILIGQDLSYGADGQTHTGDTGYGGNFVDYAKLKENEKAIKVKGNYTDYVLTNQIWFSFLKLFEIRIEKSGIKVINATEGGAYIEGTELMSLADAIAKYCPQKVLPDMDRLLEYPTVEDKAILLNRFVLTIEEVVNDFYRLEKQILKGIKLCQKIAKQQRSQLTEEDKQNANKINQIRLSFENISYIFSMIIQPIRIFNHQKDLEYQNVGSYDVFREWVDIQHNYFDEVLKILYITINLFTEGKEKVSKLFQEVT